MKALDTNVLVQFLVADDPSIATKVARMFAEADERHDPFLVTTLVLVETLWVLKARYRLSREDILDALEALIRMPALQFESPGRASELIRLGRSTRLGLGDALIGLCARDLGCESTLTLDKKAAECDLFEEIVPD